MRNTILNTDRGQFEIHLDTLNEYFMKLENSNRIGRILSASYKQEFSYHQQKICPSIEIYFLDMSGDEYILSVTGQEYNDLIDYLIKDRRLKLMNRFMNIIDNCDYILPVFADVKRYVWVVGIDAYKFLTKEVPTMNGYIYGFQLTTHPDIKRDVVYIANIYYEISEAEKISLIEKRYTNISNILKF